MKRILSLPTLKSIIAFMLLVVCSLPVSAQAYYMNIYQKDGKRMRYLVTDVDSVKFTFENAPVPGVEYVDLGLSVMWASCNLGAASPYEPGDYYSWGETQPKEKFTRESYKFYDPEILNGYTKYNFHSIYGAVDYKYRLDMEDDAARVNWGSDWRIPTIEELEELVYLCVWEWVYIDSVRSGYFITGPSGKSIFLPSGLYLDDSGYGSCTSYFSSTLNIGNVGNAMGIDFEDDYYEISGEGRMFGELIRPVYSWKAPENVMRINHFSLKESQITMAVGDVTQLNFDMDSTSLAIYPELRLSSVEYARVSQNGIIEAFAPGTFTITANLGEFTDECTVTVLEPKKVIEAVDLGLSVKWATCNLGAETPYKFGFYYAWGEVSPKYSYNLSAYKWYDLKNYSYTKYFTDPANVDASCKVKLDAEDDAAHVLWGGDWRMPTPEEFEELIENCSWEWTTEDGIIGYRITSLVEGYTGNSIFLPASGYRYYNYEYGQGEYAYYWTSSLDETEGVNDFAQYIYFDSDFMSLWHHYRYQGRTIRAVEPFGNSDIEKVVLDKDSVQLSIGAHYKLGIYGYTTSGRVVSVEDVVWNSDNPDVAVVRDGVIIAIAEGTCTISAVYNNETLKCKIVVFDPSKPQYVDLGLSVMWATFNIGANSPEEYGDYYAWGETELKDNYDMSTYKWYDYNSGNFTKYNLGAVYGDVDLKYRLDPEDDVAHVVWGDEWRLPTNEEFQELIDSCDWYWTSYNGVAGYQVQSRVNDNYIFLPVTGYKEGDVVYDRSSYNVYMSNSLYINRIGYYTVYCLEGDYLRNYYRFSGYTARAVYSSTFADNVFTVNSFTLDHKTVNMEVGQTVSLNAKVNADSLLLQIGISWVSDNVTVAQVNNKGVVVGINPGECTITASIAGLSQSCTITVTEAEIVKEWVDLGLSVKWATCNVGASRPEYAGGHYAWGETEQKSMYDWNNYKWYDASSVDNIEVTKYNARDGKIVLDPDDDVAHVMWGDDWRIPTTKECEELMNKCEWNLETVNGVSGYRVTGPNGNSIFLPSGGYFTDSVYYSGGPYYYSSMTNRNAYYCADYLYPISVDYVWKTYGFTVRPVCPYLIDDIESISLNRNNLRLMPGDTYQLEVIEQIKEAGDVQWISTDETVAIVRDGLVIALKLGTCKVIAVLGEIKDTCVINVAEPEYVNLGLSVNWATFNIGANGPEDCGEYYAWGETSTKSYYDWSSYVYAQGTNMAQTKYCTNDEYGYEGFTDGLTILESDDDIAHQKWGGEWRMPTADEFEELREKCTWKYATLNGMLGYLITSNVRGYEDNSIFLPFAGYYYNSTIQSVGECGDYWSSSLDQDYYSTEMFITSSNYTIGGWDKCWGLTIRPVCKNNDYAEQAGLYFEDDSLILAPGSVLWLAIKDENGKYCNPYAAWTSSNDDVVSVESDGTIHALAPGYAVITARYNGLTAVCTIRVVEPYYDNPDDSIQAYYEESEDGLQIRLSYIDSELSVLYTADFYESDSVITDSLSTDSIATSSFICYSMIAQIVFADAEKARQTYNKMIEEIPEDEIAQYMEKTHLTLEGNVISGVVSELIGEEKSRIESILKEMYQQFKKNKKIDLGI